MNQTHVEWISPEEKMLWVPLAGPESGKGVGWGRRHIRGWKEGEKPCEHGIRERVQWWQGPMWALPRPHPELAYYSELLHLWSHKLKYPTTNHNFLSFQISHQLPLNLFKGPPDLWLPPYIHIPVSLFLLCLHFVFPCAALDSMFPHLHFSHLTAPTSLSHWHSVELNKQSLTPEPLNCLLHAHHHHVNNQAPQHWGKSHRYH